MLLTCGTTAGLLYDCIFVSNYDDFFGKKNINDRVKSQTKEDIEKQNMKDIEFIKSLNSNVSGNYDF